MSQPSRESNQLEGAQGALLYGGFIALLMLGLSGVAYSVVVFFTRNSDLAWTMVQRLANLGLITGIVAGFSRWVCQAKTPSIFSLSMVKGDLGGIFGWVVGLCLAGAFSTGVGLGSFSGPKKTLPTSQPALQGPTLGGETFRLSDCKGSWVLVDFWATWCQPCLAESPNIQEAHRQLNDKGLKVVGVSLDFDKSALSAYLKKHPYPWPQIVFSTPDKMGFDNPLAKENQIDSIPRIWLIDPEGNLVEDDLRGPEMVTTIAGHMGVTAQPLSNQRPFVLQWVDYLIKGVLVSPLNLFWGFVLGGGVLGAMVEALLRLGWQKVRG